MSSNPRDPMTSESAPEYVLTPAEETLRLIASLPAPDGLEDRVHAALNAVPRKSRVLAWPRALRAESGWMRGAAAAAIVFVVTGGGWGVYTRVELNQPAKVIVMPARMPSTGGLSGAGAMRPPLTLPRPTAPETAKTRPAKARKKPVASGKTTSHGGHSAATSAPAAQPGASR
jgi:hypothetical protein